MSMYRFQTSGFKALLFKVYVSSLAMKIFANVTAVLVLIAVPGIYYPRNSEQTLHCQHFAFKYMLPEATRAYRRKKRIKCKVLPVPSKRKQIQRAMSILNSIIVTSLRCMLSKENRMSYTKHVHIITTFFLFKKFEFFSRFFCFPFSLPFFSLYLLPLITFLSTGKVLASALLKTWKWNIDQLGDLAYFTTNYVAKI